MLLSRDALSRRVDLLTALVRRFGGVVEVEEEDSGSFLIKAWLPTESPYATAQVRLREEWGKTTNGWLLSEYVYEYERFSQHPLAKALLGFHLHPIKSADPEGNAVLHIKCEDGAHDNDHFFSDRITAESAIDFFFRLDASDGAISPVALGLTRITRGRR